MRYRLKDILPFGKPKTPGFGINRQFYLSVLASSSKLPTLLEIVNPEEKDGAIKGFGVPLKKDSTKESLSEPLMRGAYAIASPDRKTVLRLVVVSKEEAGFDAEALVKSPLGAQFSPDTRTRVLAAWNILQFTFETHDPMVYPAIDFLHSVVRRSAETADGIIADPLSQAYIRPEEMILGHDPGMPFATQALVQVKSKEDKNGWHLWTMGLYKFNMPEIEIYGLDSTALEPGTRLLLGVAQSCLKGTKLELGEKLGSPKMPLAIAAGGLDRGMWEGIPCLELIPERTGTTTASVLQWNLELA